MPGKMERRSPGPFAAIGGASMTFLNSCVSTDTGREILIAIFGSNFGAFSGNPRKRHIEQLGHHGQVIVVQ
jgi:hypothetical protein